MYVLFLLYVCLRIDGYINCDINTNLTTKAFIRICNKTSLKMEQKLLYTIDDNDRPGHNPIINDGIFLLSNHQNAFFAAHTLL